MTVRDIHGHDLTGASAASAEAYERAAGEFRLYRGDPVASVQAAIDASPRFAMAHLLKAWLHLLGTEPSGLAVARASLDAVADAPLSARERGHATAIEHLAAGRWHDASRVMEDVSIAFPHDLLALQAGHGLDFFTGQSRMLRDRIARALPHWSERAPGYHALLGMHAFGLEECAEYGAAESRGKRAVELEPRDAWAQHAVAHVLEMQGREAEGVAWMTADTEAWSKDNFFAVHNWWHLALYRLETGDVDGVLQLFDGPIYGGRSQLALDLVDASALLWRLHLADVDVGDRWRAVADGWEAHEPGHYAFNDMHAMMAFVGAGRAQAQERVLDAQERAMRGPGDNAWFTAEVGHQATRAVHAFGQRRYRDVVRLIRPVRAIAARFGGSHAQRDVLDQMLVEAALRCGEAALARALAAERVAAKPHSPLARLFASRAERIALAA
jgi:hypothetical protein